MALKNPIIILVIFTLINQSTEDISDNQIEDADKPNISFQELGGALNDFMQSKEGQQIGKVFTDPENTAKIMEGLGSVLMKSTQQKEDLAGNIIGGLGSLLSQNNNDGGGGIDPAMIGSFLSLMGSQGSKSSGGTDIGSLIASIGGSLLQSGSAGSLMNLLPLISQTYEAFSGPDAKKRATEHQSHAWIVPPVVEALHLFADNFMHSDMGRVVLSMLGADRLMKSIADENGNFNYEKLLEMLENHSFRRYWLRIVTARLADIIIYISDPELIKRVLTYGQHTFNALIRSQGFPKAVMVDVVERPTETISHFINYAARKYFSTKVNSKDYVKPLVDYTKETFELAHQRGIVGGNSTELSDRLADLLNLDIIEPIIRVHRAYRFITKVPKCGKYVMCLVNKENPELDMLPALKRLLTRGSSLFANWFLTEHTGTSFYGLYNVMVDENCEQFYLDVCKGFHKEEERVTTEYYHNEL